MNACRTALDANRWHFQHGPIDCVIAADGERGAVVAAHEAAWRRFETVLAELVDELPVLRSAVGAACAARGPVARRMWRACAPHRDRFVTSMAAVAGAVADELIDAYRRPGVRRAWVNNGGDIALHLADDASVRVGLVADPTRVTFDGAGLAVDGGFVVSAGMAVRGIATSGWRGRSLSLGIADSVTVLAADAAGADAAATMIANAVDVDDPRIARRPACDVVDDSDLGARLVTVDVPALGDEAVHRALSSGLAHAEALRARGSIAACVLVCQGRAVSTASPSAHRPQTDALWHAPRFNVAFTEAVA